ncbi:MAG TPA: carboxypeptidase M32 [Rhodospirillaceae bacterium]|nr:carboxypeptidase M32 [Rhodospirillaceae bacterium]HAT35997.1 carboxypeptidase M32 [Rhodospirillaceae bacterium]
MVDAYAELERRFRRIDLLRQTENLLHWDQSVLMPPGGAEARGAQLAELKVIGHELITDPEIESLLEAVDETGLDDWRQANIREMRRIWANANAVPANLVAAHSTACTACESIWRTARAENDFKSVLSSFESVLSLTRDTAEAKAAFLKVEAYDALLGQYAPGMSMSEIEPIFDDYAAFLPAFLDQVMARQADAPQVVPPEGPFELEAQEAVMRKLAETVGLDFDSARLDESLHPFSAGVPEDSRITTRYAEADFGDAMMAVLHETGHAMYERGRPAEWRGQPVGRSRGMVIHESQSLLVEMQACRSREFLGWAAPVLQKAFGGKGEAWTADNLYRRATQVGPSFIRVDADEVTYPAHVILRTRLERAMLGDDLRPADLPGAWNEGMVSLLGIAPATDTEGCLQDIHWYDGAWGYFPTYTLGAMAGAQIFQSAIASDDAIVPAISQGDFMPLMAWLRKNIHGTGCLYTADELMVRATGRKLDPDAFKQHLEQRYLV